MSQLIEPHVCNTKKGMGQRFSKLTVHGCQPRETSLSIANCRYDHKYAPMTNLDNNMLLFIMLEKFLQVTLATDILTSVATQII